MEPKRYGEFTARKQSSQFILQLTKKSNNYKPKGKKTNISITRLSGENRIKLDCYTNYMCWDG